MKKLTLSKKLILAIAAAGTLGMSSAVAGVIGDTVNVTYYFPDSATVYSDLGTQIVSGAGATYNFGGYFDVLVTDTQIIAKNFKQTSSWTFASFNGFKVTDLTKNFSTTYSVDGATVMSGLTNANITNGGNFVSVNWNGLPFDPSTQVVLSSASAVPEPESYVMLLTGLGLMGFMIRRRKIS